MRPLRTPSTMRSQQYNFKNMMMAPLATLVVRLATLLLIALNASACTMALEPMASSLEDEASEEDIKVEEAALVAQAGLEGEIPTIMALALEQV